MLKYYDGKNVQTMIRTLLSLEVNDALKVCPHSSNLTELIEYV